MLKHIIPCSLILLSSVNSFAENKPIPTSRLVEVSERAVPVNRLGPKYPKNEARAGNSGWVQLSFVVDEEGKVKDVVPIADSGSKGFVRSAIRAVKKWQYSPAKVNGETVEQCENTVQLDFYMGDDGRVSRKFYRIFQQGKEALDKKDLETLTESINRIEKLKRLGVTERFWRDYLTIFQHDMLGNKSARYQSLRATYSSLSSARQLKFENKNTHVYLLSEMFIYEAQNSQFSEALAHFDSMLKIDADFAANYQKYADHITEAIAGDEPIFVEGAFSESGLWFHKLVRNEFSLPKVEGRLDKLEVRCDRKRHVFTADSSSQWSIPKSWGECTVMVYGEENTKLTLAEMNS